MLLSIENNACLPSATLKGRFAIKPYNGDIY